MSYGRKVISTLGRAIMALANLDNVAWKHGGITVDWSTVTAVSGSPVTLDDGTVIAVGDKYIPYGTVMAKIAPTEVQTVVISGTPTGGSYTLTFNGATTSAFTITTTALEMQAALEALSTVGGGNVTVARSGSSPNWTYTVTFGGALASVDSPQMTSTNGLTGGTPVITHGTTTSGAAGGGKFGPVDTTASDGRQTLTRGECYVLNETVVASDLNGDHPAVFEGGNVFKARLKVEKAAGQPTLANFLTAFPMIRLVQD